MIEETIKIHDKFQFEIKLGYKLNPDQKVTSYNIETYLFFPGSLGVNRITYTKEDFYNDIQIYIRFKTPAVLLKEITSGGSDYFTKLKATFHRLVKHQNQSTLMDFEYQLKLFCSILKSSLRDHINFLFHKRKTADITSLVKSYSGYINKITARFRELRKIINVPVISDKVFAIYLFGDEYISHLVESYTYELLEMIKRIDLKGKNSIIRELLGLIKNELHYRKVNQYRSIPSLKGNNEELIFRKSVLKKFIESILFLKTRTEREGKLLEQFTFSLASGLAMIFATGIAFYSQHKYGGFTLPVFIILIISYIFKDRFKELIRTFLSSRIHNHLYDHKMNIFVQPKNRIGICRESFYFMHEKKIPAQIRKLRNRDHITEIENGWMGEKIILHRKNIKLFSKKISRIYTGFPIEFINDIMRFNVSKFLNKMDNPEKEIYLPAGSSYKKICGERVYHLNMVIKYSLKNRFLYKRFRIILNRNGIKKIEKVSTDKEIKL